MHIPDLLQGFGVRGGILICGLNWFGDSVMSMPAVQAYRRANDCVRITMLVKPALVDLWRMHPMVDEIVPLEPGARGVLAAARSIRRSGFRTAFIFPNSTRSALPPWFGRVPARRGTRGKRRSWFLTDIVEPALAATHVHQSWEYADILGLGVGDCGDPTGDDWRPQLTIPAESAARATEMLGVAGSERVAALVPGAARGGSKRWPARHFIEVGRRIAGSCVARVAVLGTRGEMELCAGIAAGIGSDAVDLSGRTAVAELAAVLERCNVVVTNDSGGMHLATAAGGRVVAVYGLTDPAKTGPMGCGHRIIIREGVQGARDIGRESEEAERCLASIEPDEVYEAVKEMIRK